MKKRFMGIITVILTLIMSLSCLVGCNIVTTDNERDMDQIVATVDINGKQEIKKRCAHLSPRGHLRGFAGRAAGFCLSGAAGSDSCL